MLSKLGKIIAGNPLKAYWRQVEKINALEPQMEKLSLGELKNKSAELKRRSKELDEIIPEAFALVREASKRTSGERHYDVQLICGLVLHDGKIAEMLTGEGKTLASTAPIYLNALKGKGVHVVTVNDYLAKRDVGWMGQIYHALGLSVSCITNDGAFLYDPDYVPDEVEEELDKERDELGSFRVAEKFLRPTTRQEAYKQDITYGTNHQFGFDYLRDNLELNLSDKVQTEHSYVVVDEVDSILIDEARTPLIISAPDEESSKYYKQFAGVVNRLNEEEDYEVDEKHKSADITNNGIDKVQRALGLENIYAPENERLVHYLNSSLKAKGLFKKDRDYVVRDNEIVIVDQFTGRMLHGRRYSAGLHQAIEAKEGLPVQKESRTFAQITIQNYFRMYKKLSGMTGTAQTSAAEFHEVYGIDVVSIPPNRPVIRRDASDMVFKTEEAKWNAIVEEVKQRNKKGQPILLGTTSIEKNELVSNLLQKVSIEHEMLNAKNHEREGEIIAQAGKSGSVTVATNMAGRGVDIILGGNPPENGAADKVKEFGGLHVIGTERHEARRIDNQLRGRSGRQGDPGSSVFFLSMEDDLLRIFGGDRMKNMMQSLKVPDDMPIESKLVSRVVNQAQSKIEGMNLDMRKHLLDFDDVLNKQRETIYKRREKYLNAGENNNILSIIQEIVSNHANAGIDAIEAEIQQLVVEGGKDNEIEERKKILEQLHKAQGSLPGELEPERAKVIGQQLTRILDLLWLQNLDDLQSLRESVGLRAFGQKEPIVEYRREAFVLYNQLNQRFNNLAFQTVFKVLEMDLGKVKPVEEKPKIAEHRHSSGFSGSGAPKKSDGKKLGRNDLCWCGSGKKYKRCHGA